MSHRNRSIMFIQLGLAGLAVLAAVGCSSESEPSLIANPASEYCVEQGGELEIREHADGGQYGVCVFDDGSECEEWAFLRGECEPEDQKVAPVATDHVQSPTGTADDRDGAGTLPEGTTPIPVILLSDVATGLVGGWRPDVNDIDDGWAIGMAAADPALELRGVVVTFGNGLVDPQLVVAEKIVHDLIARTNIPVLRGAASPLSTQQTFWYDGRPVNPACINDGVTFMADQLRNPDQPLTLIGIGPLTDVACLVQNFPDESANIAELIALMGREPKKEFRIGDKSGLTDFNQVMDEQAIGIILEHSSIPVTYMTFQLTSNALVPRTSVEAYADDNRAIARFFYTSSVNWIDQWQRWGFDEDGFHPWDNNPVYYAAHPDAFQCAQTNTATVVACAGSPNHDGPDNLCAGHGPHQPASLNKEGSQLWLGDQAVCATNDAQCQEQVTQYRGGTVCTAYAGDATKATFLDAIFNFLGAPQ